MTCRSANQPDSETQTHPECYRIMTTAGVWHQVRHMQRCWQCWLRASTGADSGHVLRHLSAPAFHDFVVTDVSYFLYSKAHSWTGGICPSPLILQDSIIS